MLFGIGKAYGLTAPTAILSSTNEVENMLKTMNSAFSTKILEYLLIELEYLEDFINSGAINTELDYEVFYQKFGEALKIENQASAKKFRTNMLLALKGKAPRNFSYTDEQLQLFKAINENHMHTIPRNVSQQIHTEKGIVTMSPNAYLIIRNLYETATSPYQDYGKTTLEYVIDLVKTRLKRTGNSNSKLLGIRKGSVLASKSDIMIDRNINAAYRSAFDSITLPNRLEKLLDDLTNDCNLILNIVEEDEAEDVIIEEMSLENLENTLAQHGHTRSTQSLVWVIDKEIYVKLNNRMSAILEITNMYDLVSQVSGDNLARRLRVSPSDLESAIKEIEDYGIIGIYTEGLLMLENIAKVEYVAEKYTSGGQIKANDKLIENTILLKREIESKRYLINPQGAEVF